MKSTTLLTASWILLLILSCQSVQPPPKTAVTPAESSLFTSLQVKSIENPLGLELNELAFSWELATVEKQMAYQVLVASDEKKLAADVGDLWDSGKRFDSENKLIYRGKAFPTGAEAWWKVRIWNEKGEVSPYSETKQIPAEQLKPLTQRIVFLGGTLISRMEKHGWLETALTTHWPHHNLSFRNLGWPADDVFGTGRSEFGSAHNTQSWKPPDPEEGFGYRVLREHIAGAKPDVLIMGYGSEAAFAKDETAYLEFEEGYKQLLTEMESKGAKLILLSPPRQWQINPLYPDPTEQNRRLKRASKFIKELASEKGHLFVDLYEKLIPNNPDHQLTDNGIHLTSYGYQMMSQVILKELGISTEEGYKVKIDEKGNVVESDGVKINGLVRTEKGIRFDLTQDKLNATGDMAVAGNHLLKIDGEIHRVQSKQPTVISRPDSIHIEKLRQLIYKKNLYHRYRINSLNKVYTLLFRQHEMGHLAYELEDYDRLVEEQEELIAHLRLPQLHRYEVEFLEPWKSPRDYPDHEVPQNIPKPDPAKELKEFTLSEGLEINLFASDPMIANPINITWDNRGRAWVSTSSTYPHIKPGREPNDKIIILEDTDGDGKADKSTVFAENLLVPHSVMPVKGGAYVCSTTEFLFLSDKDGDDRADESRVVFSGFGNGDIHHTVHGLRWAPWGDLFFQQSININSFVETLYGFRRMNGSGVWQFRPETERLEIFSIGMINPWGFVFDDWGQAFGTDGAGGEGPTYLFPGAAHRTAVGSDRILDGMMTGKPKNTAAEFVTGRHLPKDWKGSMLSSDYRANRTVRYQITEKGSGYASEEVETIVHSLHRSYRPVDIKLGPDGAAYIVDWYSPIIDHGEVDFYHPARNRSNGRIWRLTAKDKPLVTPPNIHEASINQLLDFLKSSEQNTRLQANRELVRRNCSAKAVKEWVSKLNKKDDGYEHHRVEALWLGVALNSPDSDLLTEILQSKNHRARAAAVRMTTYMAEELDTEKLLAQRVVDSHPRVRLEAVNALRMLATPNAAHLAMKALDFPTDPELDYMIWLTVRELQNQWLPSLKAGETVFDGNFEHLSFALKAANNTQVVTSIAELVQQGKFSGEKQQQALSMIANMGGPEELQLVLDKGLNPVDGEILQALADAPSTNTAVPTNATGLADLLTHPDASIRIVAAQLIGRWKVPVDVHLLQNQAGKTNSSVNERLAAAQALVDVGKMDLLQQLSKESGSSKVQSSATAVWIKADPEGASKHAAKLLSRLKSINDARLIIQAFTGLQKGPQILTQALKNQSISEEVAVEGIRLANASGRDLSELTKAFSSAGSLKPVGMSMTYDQQQKLLAAAAKNGNASRGRQIYLRPTLVCTTCHQVNGQGGKLGPDLSTIGTFMTPSSILESLTNPNSAIKQGYETVIITRKDGTVVSGTLDRKTDKEALVRVPSGDIVSVPNSEIDKFDITAISLMPPGLTSSLREDELADLMKYLMNLGKK